MGIFKDSGLIHFREKNVQFQKGGWDMPPTLEFNRKHFEKNIKIGVFWVVESENSVRFLI